MNLLPAYEVWTWIRGYEGRFEISNRGRIRSWVGRGGITSENKGEIRFAPSPAIRVSHKNRFGYWQASIGNKKLKDNKHIRVHREVGIYFVPNPENKAEVNHLNGDKSCNEWWNFRWDNRVDNIDHAFRNGLIKPALGEAQGSAKLTNIIVLEIYKMNKPTKDISRQFNISTHTVSDIKRGRTWWHLTGHKRHIKPSEKGRFKICEP